MEERFLQIESLYGEEDLKKKKLNKKIIVIEILVLLVGSLFILETEGVLNVELLPNILFGSVSAQVEEINTEITRTSSTETTCNNGTCNLILYSGIRFVEEDNQWKKVEEARSLKNKGFNIVYLENDGTHKIDVVDFNMTYIELNFSYDKNNLGEFELEVEDGKMKTKYKIIETLFNETTREPYDVETEVEIEIEEDGQRNIIFNENPFGKEFKLGENSTTIKLQEPDTENLDDTYLAVGSPTGAFGEKTTLFMRSDTSQLNFPYVKFNISSVPFGQQIDDAQLYLYHFSHAGGSGNENWTINHVYNFSWEEGSSLGGPATYPNITWGNQPCGPNFDISAECNLTAMNWTVFDGITPKWVNWEITDAVKNEYDEGDKNVSVTIRDSTGSPVWRAEFYTKEFTTDTTLRPFLNITYSEPPAPVVNLDSPSNNTITNVLNQIFNASYTATVGDLVNATLSIWNSTSSLVYNETDSVSGSSNSSSINFTFSVDDVYVWNYEVCDDSVLCGSNITNFTITIDTTPPTFDNLANQSADANTTFTFDINATDALSPISCFTVNDTTNFQIDCNGVLQNNTVLNVQVYPLNISVNDSLNNTAYGTMDVNVSVFDTILKWDWAALMTDLISPDQICFIFRGDKEYCINSGTITGKWNLSGINLFPSDLSNNVGIGTSTPQNKLNVVGDFNVTGDIIMGGNLTTSNEGTIWDNETCVFISSPGGNSILEVCD